MTTNKVITDASKDKTISREETTEEIKQHLEDVKASQEAQNQVEQIATAKAALLAKLGITADEAALLLS
jgi:hypothetical protein